MENKLEVGMWARTEYGRIFKIKAIKEYSPKGKWYLGNSTNRAIKVRKLDKDEYIVCGEIIKTSFNKLDLVRAGDFIKLTLILNLLEVYEKDGELYIGDSKCEYKVNGLKFVESIITKEQYNNTVYKFDEERKED